DGPQGFTVARRRRMMDSLLPPGAGNDQESGGMVAEDASKTHSPFYVRSIKYLVGLMSQHDLSEIDLREGDLRIRLRRGARKVLVTPSPSPPGAASSPAAQPLASASPGPAPSSPALHLIKSPTPGTFYTSPSPDAEPFVQIGTRVTPTTVVCVIEAMKIF